ncbi:TPA: YopX family protein [Campylobacter lari subsp. concheus]
MKLKDFDFRIWNNEDNLYLEQKYTKRFNCYDSKGYAVGLVGNGHIKLVYEIVTGVDSTQDGLNDYEWVQNLGENKWEIELWTGFYDKNGKKIYENDILKNEVFDEYYLVSWNETSKMLRVYTYDTNSQGKLYKKENAVDISFFKTIPSNKYMEVIGNIHENPELLKC